jgi:hypothetical protein
MSSNLGVTGHWTNPIRNYQRLFRSLFYDTEFARTLQLQTHHAPWHPSSGHGSASHSATAMVAISPTTNTYSIGAAVLRDPI